MFSPIQGVLRIVIVLHNRRTIGVSLVIILSCEAILHTDHRLHLPEYLTTEEVDQLENAIDLSKWEGQRNKAIIEVLFSCGLRVSELVNLKLSNLFEEEKFVRILGKGNKERLVPISHRH